MIVNGAGSQGREMTESETMSTAMYAVVDPSTGDLVKEYPTATDEQVEQAVAAAAKAHTEWSRGSTVAERAALIRKVGQLHTERKDELAKIIQREMGKPLDQSEGEVDFSAAIYEYYADNLEKFLADEPIELVEGEGSALIRRSSVGVLLGIMPWNYPYYQVARFVGPNLALGNTIVLKHAPQCPESAAALQQIFIDAGYPEGAYVNVYATNEQIADVIADPRIQGVSLTGSERAGAAVAEIAGRNLKKVVLELGGSDPFILLSADDLDSAVEAAIDGRFENTGQACNAAKRILVAEDIYDDFLDKFTKKVLEKADGMAPLSSAAAAELLDKQVKRAVDDGATLVSAGERNGAYFPPGVLTGVSPDSPSYKEELFGPVATVYKVTSEDHAVEVANDTPFGLGSYVFTTDAEQARRVADKIEAGMVFVNAVGAEGVELPFGGVKRSGFGRELGHFGIDEFVNKKLIRIS
ncbi:succinate-semialdehyde dehydrogenase [Mycolicibacterium cyprinidarum]|uniref:Succinate-semialdehyde dehydrogenase n=1 Tax=Mycolicibacterium cyprinidarum TaxID=2860311 RepID=A0ABQ4V6P6_9MYCO|nr:succinate-semialdehyde dehydrogenase [Mycolicibacterium sp. NGTWSNA01]GJF16752.1 succinate-semialdehyde dehydrogenase [Mycolicibacterium sp. NGTWS0302]